MKLISKQLTKKQLFDLQFKYDINPIYKVQFVLFWDKISMELLSEEFMREFADFLDWKLISDMQEMSADFILEFKDKIVWSRLVYNKKLSYECRKELYERSEGRYPSWGVF